jgi:hypothetical protein
MHSLAHETAGAARIRHSLLPSWRERSKIQQARTQLRRENAELRWLRKEEDFCPDPEKQVRSRRSAIAPAAGGSAGAETWSYNAASTAFAISAVPLLPPNSIGLIPSA